VKPEGDVGVIGISDFAQVRSLEGYLHVVALRELPV